MRLSYPCQIGMFARIAHTIGKHGGGLGAVDIVGSDRKGMTRDITVPPRDAAQQEELVAAVRRLAGVKVIDVSDRVFLLALGGKIALQNKVPLVTRDALSMALHARGGARLRGDCRANAQGLALDDQRQLGGGRQRWHGGAGVGRHRPGARDAGDGQARRCCPRNLAALTLVRFA
jgi:hypothetical protein